MEKGAITLPVPASITVPGAGHIPSEWWVISVFGHAILLSQLGTVDAEIRIRSAEKPKQSEASTGGGLYHSDFSLILIHFKFNYRSVCSISPSND